MHSVRLGIQVGDQTLRIFVLRPGRKLVLGRGANADIHLDDTHVSREHATLDLLSDGLYVTDLGSQNGTFLGRLRIDPQTTKRHAEGEIIQLGSTTVSVTPLAVEGREKASPSQSLPRLPRLPKGEFEFLGEIATGSVGRVWAARQKNPPRKVAIKALREDAEVNREDRERFEREARLYRRVRSPFVVELYDVLVVPPSQQICLIMELVQGPTALTCLERGLLRIPDALRIGSHVAQALEALAELGIVHRDVKPGNILMGEGVVAKLGDFGIAKEPGGGNLTEPDVALGTLHYLAPEQAMDPESLHPSVDVYGLGATLYHLVSGRPPLELMEEPNLLRRIERLVSAAPVPLTSVNPTCPDPVAALIHRMLGKDPQARPSAARVAKELTALLETHYPGYTPHSLDTQMERVDEVPPVFRLYQLVARHERTDDMVELARALLDTGKGSDQGEAVRWLKRAAGRGSEEADQLLGELTTGNE